MKFRIKSKTFKDGRTEYYIQYKKYFFSSWVYLEDIFGIVTEFTLEEARREVKYLENKHIVTKEEVVK